MANPLIVRYRLTPWWLRVLAIFIASRIVTTTLLLIYAAHQQANAWTGPNPGYFDFSKIWDGHWYYIISVSGYPSELPLTADGHVGENAWAFLPAYPSLVRLIMAVTSIDFRVVAVFVSVGFALGAALMFYKLMRLYLPAGTALFSVTLFCFAPLSPVLQVAYAESMYIFLLVLALYFLAKRNYWMLLPVIAVMSLTRPSGLAFALALGLHVTYRLFTLRRDPFPVGERIAAIVATLFSAFMGVSWVLIAWAVTGSATAYTDTELVWRAPYIGYQELVPFTQLVKAAGFWLQFPAGLGIVIVTAILLVIFVVALFTPPVRKLGVDIRFWLASYLLYLLAVFFPQSSTFRLLLPVFPLLGAVAQPKSRIYRAAVLVAFVAGQVLWIHIAWWVDGRDWTPP